MKILLISALEIELKKLIEKFSPEVFFKHGKFVIYKKELPKNELYFGITGVGRKNVREFYDYYSRLNVNAEYIISTGYAGAVNYGLVPGDVILPKYYFSFDRKDNGEIKEERKLFFLPKEEFDFPVKYHGLTGVEVGKLADSEYKKQLKKEFYQADFVDMESGEIINACLKNKIRFLLIRAITDEVNFKFPEEKYFKFLDNENIKMKLQEFLLSLLLHPLNFYRLIKLRKNTKLATTKLNELLERFLLNL